jgi:hypothetical protein
MILDRTRCLLVHVGCSDCSDSLSKLVDPEAIISVETPIENLSVPIFETEVQERNQAIIVGDPLAATYAAP